MRVIDEFFVYLLLVFSTFLSCKSTKNVSDFREVSQLQLLDSTALQLSQGAKAEELLHSDLFLDENCDIDFTVYLPPDSAGVQPVKAKGKIKKSKNVLHQEQRIHNKEETAKAQKNQQQNIASERETEDKQEDFKSAEPINLKPLAYILLTLLAFTLIYKLRKWLR